jgi:hypothetical protein
MKTVQDIALPILHVLAVSSYPEDIGTIIVSILSNFFKAT